MLSCAKKHKKYGGFLTFWQSFYVLLIWRWRSPNIECYPTVSHSAHTKKQGRLLLKSCACRFIISSTIVKKQRVRQAAKWPQENIKTILVYCHVFAGVDTVDIYSSLLIMYNICRWGAPCGIWILILSHGNWTCRISERHLLGHKIVS